MPDILANNRKANYTHTARIGTLRARSPCRSACLLHLFHRRIGCTRRLRR